MSIEPMKRVPYNPEAYQTKPGKTNPPKRRLRYRPYNFPGPEVAEAPETAQAEAPQAESPEPSGDAPAPAPAPKRTRAPKATDESAG